MSEVIVLRDYQTGSVRKVITAAKAGHKRIVVGIPTGGGKTEVIAELCRIAKRALVISPMLIVMHQTIKRLEERLGERVDVEQGGRFAEFQEGLRCRVIAASRDSLLSDDRYKLTAYEGITLVVVDEIHLGTTPRFEALLKHFESRGAVIVGFSATPYKKRGKALRYWPRPVVSYGMLDFINEGWLVGPKCHLSESKDVDLTLVEEIEGEWGDKAQLAAVLAAEHLAQEVTSLVLQTHNNKPSIVYAANVRQARLISEVFDRYGHPTSLVHSNQNSVERDANMKAYLSGDTKIIVNVGILSCGWDHPEVRNIYFAAPQRSLSRYEQRLGRGTRPLPGVLKPGMSREERLAAIAASDKPHFNVWDITDSSRSHQILNAIDVLDAQTRKSAQRRERVVSALGTDGVVATDVIAAQNAIDEQEAEALREKRKKLIVGVTFGHEQRDLFSEPEAKKKRGWRMFYGKYRGVLLDDIPTSYLSHVLATTKKETPLKAAVRRVVERRANDTGRSRSA